MFSRDGSRLSAPTFPELSVIVWEVATGRRLATIPVEGRVGAELHYHEFYDGGSKILISARDNSFELWDIESQSKVRAFQGPRASDRFFSFRASPDFKYGTSSRNDENTMPWGGSLIWDLESGRLHAEVPPIPGGMGILSTTDSSTMARCVMDGSVVVFGIPSGRIITKFSGVSDSLFWPWFSGDGTRLAVGDFSGGMARVIAPADTMHPTDLLEGHTDVVYYAIYSPDGNRIATASHDNTIVIWDAAKRSPIHTLNHDGELWRLCFSPDGKLLLSESWDGFSRLWDTETGIERHKIAGGPPSLGWLSGPRGYYWRQYNRYASENRFSPGGDRYLVATPKNEVLIVDAQSGETLHTLSGHEDFCFNAEFSPRGDRVVTMAGNTLRLWNADTGEQIPWEAEFRLFAFSPDGERILTGSTKGSLMIWDAETATPLIEPDGKDSNFYWARFSDHGDKVVLARTYGALSVRDATTGGLLQELSGHKVLIDAYFSPDGSRILTREEAGAVRVWDHQQGNELIMLEFDNEPLQAAWSPDGTSVIICDGNITQIYDAIQSQELEQLGDDTSSLDDRIRHWFQTRNH